MNNPVDEASILGARRPLFRIEVVLAVALSFIQLLLMSRLWVGDFFNSYYYISDDGFDWITQGVAFNQLIAGQDASSWPVLRQPVFVMVMALDNALGMPGVVFVLSQAGAVGATAYLIGRFARKKRLGPLAAACLMLAWYFFVFGFYRLWVLSDTIAAAFMTASVALLLDALDAPNDLSLLASARRLGPAVLATALAGLTQTYGLIPFLVICGVHGLAALVLRHRPAEFFRAAGAGAAAAILVFGGQAVWAAAIPHQSQPTQFGLLQLSLAMGPFYLNVWSIAFGALAPAVALGAFSKWRRRSWPSVEELGLVTAAGAFAALSFIYQWPESRLTFMYMPIVWLALAAWCARPPGENPDRSVSGALIGSSIATVLVGLLIMPGDFWRPRLLGARIDPFASWVATSLRDGPVDRFYLQTQCTGMTDMCERAVFDPQSSPYRTMMFEEYRRRITAEHKH